MARFYDPALGRFIQADTLIPEPGSPQSWDRYAYVNNNPVRFTDPSGHYYCEGDTTCTHNTLHTYTYRGYITYRINSDYGISVDDQWDTNNLHNLLGALDNLESTFGNLKYFTNGTTYSYTYNSQNYGGYAVGGGNIAFHGPNGGIPYQNFYHEIAHAINYQAGGFFTKALNAEIIYDHNGDYLMGGPEKSYARNSKGYIKVRIPDPIGVYVDAQQHPGNSSCAPDNTWCIMGNSSTEEWADLIANYTAGNFGGKAGAIRQMWLTEVWKSFWVSQP